MRDCLSDCRMLAAANVVALFCVAGQTVLAEGLAERDLPRPEYPRPQFERSDWVNLNGLAWTFAYDQDRVGLKDGLQRAKGFDRRINVPFCPQSKLSLVGNTDFIKGMWYHRRLDVPAGWKGRKVLLNFGAVDWECEVFIDGAHAGQHFGGSASFSVDVTRFVTPGRSHDLVVRVEDDLPQQPRGKQCHKRESFGCLYTRVTGIWQTVWMEAVDARGLASCRVIPDAANGTFAFQPTFYGAAERIAIRLSANGACVAEEEFAASDGATHVLKPTVKRLWSPKDPFLYDIVYEVKDAAGRIVDTVRSYAGLRTVKVAGNRVLLNGEPFYFRLVLDQGYYPDGIWTAPDDAALRRDIELSMAAGFNGARLHQKVFEERFHYWADKLGYVTWGENASWGASMENDRGARNFLSEWSEIVRRDANHPSIVAWTPLNETRPGETKAFRRGQTDLYDLTKALDPTRPVNEASGYTHWKTDLWTVHNYDRPPKLKELDQGPDRVWAYARDVTNSVAYGGQPYLNDEFGGMKWIPKGRTAYAGNTWGYGGGLKSEEDFLRLLKEEVDVQDSIPHLSGWCYTQLTDVEQEQNGIYNYDRTPKFDMKRVKAIFTGNGR